MDQLPDPGLLAASEASIASELAGAAVSGGRAGTTGTIVGDDEPFAADNGPIGVLLSHGFTGKPASMRPWAQALSDAGLSVRVPLLPGHAGTWRDINRTRWTDWYAAVEDSYRELAARCDTVFACGLSMGGTLVTRLAAEHPDGIAGLVLVNPAFATTRLDAKLAPYIAWAVRSRPSIGGDIKKPGVVEPAGDRTPVIAFASLFKLWKLTVPMLPQVTAPILLYRSRIDHVVEPLSAHLLHTRAVNTSVHEVTLEDSYHVATLDNDAPTIFAGSIEFIRETVAARERSA